MRAYAEFRCKSFLKAPAPRHVVMAAQLLPVRRERRRPQRDECMSMAARRQSIGARLPRTTLADAAENFFLHEFT